MEGVGVYREFIGSAVDERLLSVIQGTVCATVNKFGVKTVPMALIIKLSLGSVVFYSWSRHT